MPRPQLTKPYSGGDSSACAVVVSAEQQSLHESSKDANWLVGLKGGREVRLCISHGVSTLRIPHA